MAWYKDPETDEIVEVNLFEKNTSDATSMKAVQSSILVVPFNVPYKTDDVTMNKSPNDLFWDDLYGKFSFSSATGIKKGFNSFSIPAIADNSYWRAWIPWNINHQLDPTTGNWYNPYQTIDVWLTSNTLPGESMQQKNPTKYVGADGATKVWQFKGTLNSDSQADPFRALTHLGCLVEATPKDSKKFLKKHIQFAFNTYSFDSADQFKDPNSKYWKLDNANGVNGFSSENLVLVTEQFDHNLHAKLNKIQIRGGGETGAGAWSNFNPIIRKLWAGSDENKGQWDDPNAGVEKLKPSGMPFQSDSDAQQLIFPKNYMAATFKDSTFEIQKPSLERAYKFNVGEEMGLSNPVKVQSHYNFYLLPYEKAISDYPTKGDMQVKVPYVSSGQKWQDLVPIPEQLLPNIYALIYDQISEEPYFRYADQGSWMPAAAFKWAKKENGSLKFDAPKNAVTPANRKFMVDVLGQFLSITTKKNTVNETPVKNIPEYLNSWANMMGYLNAPTDSISTSKAYEEWKSPWIPSIYGANKKAKSTPVAIQEKKYNVVGVSAYKMKDFRDEAEKLKKMFPFHVDIDVPMANDGFIGKVLFESGLTDIFMQNCMAALFTVYNVIPGVTGGNPAGTRKFYEALSVHAASSHRDVCLVRKDRAPEMEDGVLKITPEQHTMFNETLLQLWLNPILESAFLLDLDTAKAVPGSNLDYNFLADYYGDVPSHYYDWINYKSSQEYIEQITRLKGLSSADHWFPQPTAAQHLNVLKPVVFGKKPVASTAQSLISWLSAKVKINKFINERVRNVKDVFQGKKAHSEVLFYEIVKYASGGAQKGGTSFGTNALNHSINANAGYIPKYTYGAGPTQQSISENTEQGLDAVAPPAGGPENPSGRQGWIQSFFIPNVPGVDVAKYVDTQVKHDKGYYYQVYAHTLVVGTQYECAVKKLTGEVNSNWPHNTIFDFTLHYAYKPAVQLFRVPYYNTVATANESVIVEKDETTDFNPNKSNLSALETTLVWDSPPIFPDAVFLPFYGEKDRVLINCNFNSGEYELNPVNLQESEKALSNEETLAHSKARISQKKLGGPITYSSDDVCGAIEILRIDKKPKSYLDFSPPSQTKIATVGSGKSNFGFIDDTLEANKDYYYLVREIDVHGNYSNPSPVYFARIVYKDGEAPYTIFKMYFMEELQKEKLISTKNFMKYIMIKPGFDQRVVNEGEIESYASSELLGANGNLDQMIGELNLNKAIWGKKFKFRFTSKKTGRKFDLNLTVKDVKKLEKQIGSTAGEPDTYSSGKC